MAWLNRREFLKVLGVTTAAGTAARPGLCAARPQAASDRKPNFILIFTDDQGYGDLSCFGSKRIDSKHLDRMAAEGMKFTSFYVVGAVCTPSRAGLMTGCYAQRVGLPGVLFPNSMPRGQRDGQAVGLNPDEVTIAEVLKEVGYATCCIGKWHLGDRKQFLPTSHGFDEYFGLPYSNDMHLANKKYKWPPLPLMRNEEVVEREPDQDHLTRRYTEEAITFIRKNRDRPFFLYLPHSMPHRPIHVSPAFAKRFSKEEMAQIGKRPYKADRDFLYPGAIEEIDWSCGQILRAEGPRHRRPYVGRVHVGQRPGGPGQRGRYGAERAPRSRVACACRASCAGLGRWRPGRSVTRSPRRWISSRRSRHWPAARYRRIG